jgi:hypothetical protein
MLERSDKQIGPVGGGVPLERSPYGAADHKAFTIDHAMLAHDGQRLLLYSASDLGRCLDESHLRLCDEHPVHTHIHDAIEESNEEEQAE